MRARHLWVGWLWIGLMIAFSGGCSGPQEPNGTTPTKSQVPNNWQIQQTSLQVGATLQAAGTLTSREARLMLHVQQERSWDVFVTPAFPQANERVLWVALSPKVTSGQAPTATVRWTKDEWKSHTDTQGNTFSWEGRQGYVFDLGKHITGTKLQAAFRVQWLQQDEWLNRGKQNYEIQVTTPKKLDWLGQVQVSQNGLTRKVPGDTVFAGQPVEVSVQTYPMTPGVDVNLHWTSKGFSNAQTIPMRLVESHVGSYGNNAKWEATIPTKLWSGDKELVFWVEAKGQDKTLWASRNGANYKAVIQKPPQPTWAQAGVYLWSKAHRLPDGSWSYMNWRYYPSLGNPFRATPSQYQAYASAPIPAIEVYVPGVTDNMKDRDSLRGFVRAEVWSPFFSGSPQGTWKAHPMTFREWAGNNMRFQWNVREFRAPNMPAIGVDCAVDGSYPFKFRLSTDNGTTWHWLGLEGIPQGGKDRTMEWQNQSYPPNLSLVGQRSGQPMEWTSTTGQTTSRTLTFVNTNSHDVVVASVWLQSPTGWSLQIPGCSDPKTCVRTLKPGDRMNMDVAFSPATSGTSRNQLLLRLKDPLRPCVRSGTHTASLRGITTP
ncbi:MAG: hypothetical protein EP343_14975 [Deltaproteobacteria bacterium]|nr:MAG: hypothetical protein EP343_14975 [Deltaproteobacteria bacterium]